MWVSLKQVQFTVFKLGGALIFYLHKLRFLLQENMHSEIGDYWHVGSKRPKCVNPVIMESYWNKA